MAIAVSQATGYPLGSPQTSMSNAQNAAKFHSITGHPAAQFEPLLGWAEAPGIANHFRMALT